jgi:hypothetical protein
METRLKSYVMVAKEDDSFDWKTYTVLKTDARFPVRTYLVVNGVEVAVLRDDNANTAFVFNNDPNFTVWEGENAHLGMGAFLWMDGRSIHIPTFRRGDDAFDKAKAGYSVPKQVASILDLFFDGDALLIGNSVKAKMAIDATERARVTDLVRRLREHNPDEAEVVLVRYGLEKIV